MISAVIIYSHISKSDIMFRGIRLDMYSMEDYGIHHMQVAIVRIWQLEMLEGNEKERQYRSENNIRKMDNIINLCHLAITADPSNTAARFIFFSSRHGGAETCVLLISSECN